MSRQEMLTLVASAALACIAPRARAAGPAAFDGQAALDATRRIVAFGPRPAGSPALRQMRRWLLAELRPLHCEIAEDSFTAQTPKGPRAMVNIIAKFSGTPPAGAPAPGAKSPRAAFSHGLPASTAAVAHAAVLDAAFIQTASRGASFRVSAQNSAASAAGQRIVVISGHYDTYDRPGLHFVGANDGGSSAAFLLQLARTLVHFRHQDTIWLVWFDGEESIVNWEGEDHTYGSRHLAQKWKADGTADSILALINVDMIGDADLSLIYELNSTSWLRDLVWSVAARLGYTSQFPRSLPSAIADDHIPFQDIGVPVLDLIDLAYGPDNIYWHTDRDTVDKLSARSFDVVGQVVLESIRALEHRTSRW